MQPLFSSNDLPGSTENQLRGMREKVERLDEDYLLAAAEEDLVLALAEEAKWDVPTLGEPYIARECEVDIRKREPLWEEIYTVKGSQITFRIPFTGDASFFWMRPPHQQWAPPAAGIYKGYVEVTYQGDELDGEKVRQELNNLIKSINSNLEQLAVVAAANNAALADKARGFIQARRNRILGRRKMVASIGLPVQHRDNAPKTYSVPDIRRKPQITMPVVKEKAFVAEPSLSDTEYENILSIMRGMVRVMELSPNAFRNLEEEELRWHFLIQLNGQYLGRASGETFNYKGKTDILIREKERNVFIAECKYWKGCESLTEALDQILDRYLHWRDTKAAVLIFNRNKDFSRVLAQIAPTVEKHSCFKRTVGKVGETEWKFVFASRDDRNREIHLTIMVFDVPKNP